MSMPQTAHSSETTTPVRAANPDHLTPVCGPLRVEVSTNPQVVPPGDFASIQKDDAGNEYFCLVNSVDPVEDRVVPVQAPSDRQQSGPWLGTQLARIGGRQYEVQTSVVNPGTPAAHLYGIFVPVSGAARTRVEEPIVVWGSEDEGEGPPDVEPGRE